MNDDLFSVAFTDDDAERAVIAGMFWNDEWATHAKSTLVADDFRVPLMRRFFVAHVERPDIVNMRCVTMEDFAVRAASCGVEEFEFNEVKTFDKMAITRAQFDGDVSRVLAARIRRDSIGPVEETREAIIAGASAEAIIAHCEDLTRAVTESVAGDHALAAEQVGSFIEDTNVVYDWIIPGCLDRGERCLVTAESGAGKSVMVRQLAVQVAAGIHPWPTPGRYGQSDMQPRRVLLCDFENARSMIARSMASLTTLAMRTTGEVAEELDLHVCSAEEGINLTKPGDRRRLLHLVRETAPDLVCIGPLYKMFTWGDSKMGGEDVAHTVMSVVNEIRTRYRAAVLIEAHAASGSTTGAVRGSSAFTNIPEHGFHLARVNPNANDEWLWKPFRGGREMRDWPKTLHREWDANVPEWPWTVASHERREDGYYDPRRNGVHDQHGDF